MKIVQINATCGHGSTGKICISLSRLMDMERIENYIIHSGEVSERSNSFSFASKNYVRMQALKARIFGNWGFNSAKATKRIIEKLEEISPDIVHLHNIHGHDCNLEQLFFYFKKKHTKVVWTFHDCWAFTGYCMHFITAKCDKWKTECINCTQKSKYSWFLDRSRELQDSKKKLLADIDLAVVVPSEWMADNVKASFLSVHSVYVINNGIDLTIFKCTESDFREKLGIGERFLVLGVAFGWDEKKGLDVFIELSKQLGEQYQIVLVGTDNIIEKYLPDNIISVHRTQDQYELAGIYSSADIFVNPTREDTYPTVNMEAIACGTPVVTFRTGGSPEIIDATCGVVVDVDDMDALQTEIKHICKYKPYSREACLKRAKSFDMNACYRDYIDLYRRVYDEPTKS